VTTAPIAPTARPLPEAAMPAARAPHPSGSGLPAITLPPTTTTAPAPTTFREAGLAHYESQVAIAEVKAAAVDSAPPVFTRPARPATANARPTTAPAGPATKTTAQAPDKKPLFDRVGPWIALLAAVGLTASGEYGLARMVGFPSSIAWALPTAIDVYVIQAMRRHRDVAAALILMIATNALLHLAEAHLVGVTKTGRPHHETWTTQWWLIVLVAAIAPLIVWRVHRITETHPEKVAATAARNDLRKSETVSGETASATDVSRETAVARDTVAAAATPRGTVSATLPDRSTVPSETVGGTLPGRSTTDRETASATQRPATPAMGETAPPQRAMGGAARNATPRTRPAATPRETTGSVATPIDRNAQLDIVSRFVDEWNGPDEKLPLQPIADALGRSKPTASRLVREYRNLKSA
jgi:hypothetical protein